MTWSVARQSARSDDAGRRAVILVHDQHERVAAAAEVVARDRPDLRGPRPTRATSRRPSSTAVAIRSWGVDQVEVDAG